MRRHTAKHDTLRELLRRHCGANEVRRGQVVMVEVVTVALGQSKSASDDLMD